MLSNKLCDFDLLIELHIDGQRSSWALRARKLFPYQISGIQTSATTILPFKFQETELVGAFPEYLLDNMFGPNLLLKIPTWKMPLSCRKWGPSKFELIAATSCALQNTYILISDYVEDVYQSAARRQGGIMSGTTPPKLSRQILIRMRSFVLSTADEAPTNPVNAVVDREMVDPPSAPYASVKLFYRPKGGPFHAFPAI